MAVQSGKTQLGTPLPDVTVHDMDGNAVNLRELRGDSVLVVVFVCNHCPYVRHVEGRLADVAAQLPDNVRVVAIVSNDIATHPDDDIPGMREQIQRAGWEFPYLIDQDQSAALGLGAACTPDFFVYGTDGSLTYRGAFDRSSPKNGEPLTGELLVDAVTRTLAGEPVPEPHRQALGCGIKWLPGNEPEAVSFL